MSSFMLETTPCERSCETSCATAGARCPIVSTWRKLSENFGKPPVWFQEKVKNMYATLLHYGLQPVADDAHNSASINMGEMLQ